ncbi:M48 family metalloprotease [Streptomyces sp. SID8366]|uniref:M48 family metalloprotease n=1 Tax=unclassified Streptomyces TaxID=2593676 RepID=UPI000DB9AC03|nr:MULTISPECIES: M48 family metalloprotease [unclassified Streptomyces]MYU02841.1 M48 family metalloprotease [Streptomyces sp. SID8366]MYU61974.1 M48 family metalloprotease [Streptomyces sp. SID69]RAJ52591.1 Zn-dependent protease with chaperone function [Streptomyces sp. PsTaAH-130]
MPTPGETAKSAPTPADGASPASAPATPLLRTGRIHISARQRGADITALVRLALHLPQVLLSAAVVLATACTVEALGGPPWWLGFAGWALSGLLLFHRPCERVIARRLFGLRYPTPKEAPTLRAVWREVTARAGVDGAAYQLWVEESPELNAMATAGHIVGVTSHSLSSLPPPQLAGVLAHELGHQVRGHAWATLLVFWYALPGRLAARLLWRLAKRTDRMSAGATLITAIVIGAVVIALVTATYGLILFPLITPYLAAAVSRRSELRADDHAADLGFAAELMAVLGDESEREPVQRPERRSLGSADGPVLTRLLDSHPDIHTRLHHLQARLERRR